MKSRLVLFVVLLVVWAGALTARLHQVQVAEHDRYRAKARRQHLEPIELVPPRGAILDREGRKLAVSVEVDSFYAETAIEDPATVARVMAGILGTSSETLEAKLADEPWDWLARQVEPRVAKKLRQLELEGVKSLRETKRFYPLGSLAGPVLGFVGVDHNGLAGLEAAYNDVVTGDRVDRMVLRDALAGQAVAPGLSLIDAEPGDDLHLTIDADVQYIVERELAAAIEAHSARRATAVLMDPRTGAIYAMASVPSFDPNRYQSYGAQKRRNRVIQDAYEPGSTLKLVTAAAALEANRLDPLDVLDCERGAITLGSVRIRDHKPFDLLTFGEVFARSSNVGAIKAGLLVGEAGLSREIEAFGFGRPTGIDLPGENRGILRPVERWSRHEVAYASIGQGVSVTPLQLARAFAAVANGGHLVRPHVVSAIGAISVVPERESEQAILSEATTRTLLRMLETVVEEGTGFAAAVDGYRVAGKTGTAQKAGASGYAPDLYVASFAGFAPSRAPGIVGVVTIDEPRGKYHGGEVAAPVFATILNQVLPLLGIAPQARPADRPPPMAAASGDHGDDSRALEPARRAPRLPVGDRVVVEGTVPDFAGLTAREALRLASRAGLEIRLHGSGFVRRQAPGAGGRIEAENTIVLHLQSGRSG